MSFISNSKVYIISFPYMPEDEMIKLCQDFNTRPQRDQMQKDTTELIENAVFELKKYAKENWSTGLINYQTHCDGPTNPWIAVRALNEDTILKALEETNLFDKILEVHEHGKVPVRKSTLA